MSQEGELVIDTLVAGHVIGVGVLRRARRKEPPHRYEALWDLEADVRLEVLISSILWQLRWPLRSADELDLALSELLETIPHASRGGVYLHVALAAYDCRHVLQQAGTLRRRRRLVEGRRIAERAAEHLLQALDEAVAVFTSGQAQVVIDRNGDIDLAPRGSNPKVWEVSDG